MIPVEEHDEDESTRRDATDRLNITYSSTTGKIITWPFRKAVVWIRAFIGFLRWYSMPLLVLLLILLGVWYLSTGF